MTLSSRLKTVSSGVKLIRILTCLGRCIFSPWPKQRWTIKDGTHYCLLTWLPYLSGSINRHTPWEQSQNSNSLQTKRDYLMYKQERREVEIYGYAFTNKKQQGSLNTYIIKHTHTDRAASHYSLLQQPRRRQTHTQMQQKRTSVTKPAAPAIKIVIFKGSGRRGGRVFPQSWVERVV